MNKERDLLPWILGGVSVATIAVAFAAISTHTAAAILRPTPPAAALPAPHPPAAQTPAPATVPDSASVSAPPQPAAAVEPQVQAGQIWQCTTHGVKTFSNNPCGEKSALLEVSPINTMSAPAAIHYARAYSPDPRYAQGFDRAPPGDDEQSSEDYGAEAGNNSYTIIQGRALIARRRPEHSHRPTPQNPRHASGPMQR